jgi:uncharacterized membrane protein
MSELRKLEFLYQSIGDIRSTIRALDTKVSFLLVVLFIPVNKLGRIYAKIRELLVSGNILVQISTAIIGVVFAVTWAVALWSALRTLMGIYNPRHSIDGDRPEGCFFPANLFSFGLLDVLFKGAARSNVQFSGYAKSIPGEEREIADQVVFEQMKLIYITMLKSKRCQLAYWATLFWTLSGGILWLMHLLTQ